MSEQTLDIMACLQLNADLPWNEAARISGYREHTVRYTMNKLLEQGIIYKLPVLNLTALGMDEYHVLFSIDPSKAAQCKKMLESLKNCQALRWLHEMGGEYQYAMGVISRSPSELKRRSRADR